MKSKMFHADMKSKMLHAVILFLNPKYSNILGCVFLSRFTNYTLIMLWKFQAYLLISQN